MNWLELYSLFLSFLIMDCIKYGRCLSDLTHMLFLFTTVHIAATLQWYIGCMQFAYNYHTAIIKLPPEL